MVCCSFVEVTAKQPDQQANACPDAGNDESAV